MNIFFKFSYSAVDLQTYFNAGSQGQGRTNGGVTPFHVEIMAAYQPNFKISVGKFVSFYSHNP